MNPKNPIKVVAFVKTTLTEQQILDAVSHTINTTKNEPVIIVFPEGVIKKIISRNKGKEIAQKIHKLIAQHKNAYVFLSLLETKTLNGQPLYSNTGYIITQTKKKNG